MECCFINLFVSHFGCQTKNKKNSKLLRAVTRGIKTQEVKRPSKKKIISKLYVHLRYVKSVCTFSTELEY